MQGKVSLANLTKALELGMTPQGTKDQKPWLGFDSLEDTSVVLVTFFTHIPHRSNLGEKQFCLTPCFGSLNTPECMVGWLTTWQGEWVEGAVHIQPRKKRELNQNCWLSRSFTVPLPHLMWPLIAPQPYFLIAVHPLQIALPSGNYRRSFSVSQQSTLSSSQLPNNHIES